MNFRCLAPALAAVAIAAMVSTSAHAAPLVTNGNFTFTTQTTFDPSFQLFNSGYFGTVPGWTNTNPDDMGSYNFLMNPLVNSAVGMYGPISLYGAGGALTGPPVSPDGYNYMAMDSDFQDSALQQTINGLTVGDSYAVSFYYAATQQIGYSGASHETFDVSLGSSEQSTPILYDPSEDFTGWDSASMTFTATSTQEVLSFMAVGGADGSNANVPSFALLDGVSMTQVPSPTPEPSSLVLLGSGLAGLAGMVRARFAKAAASAV